MSARDFMAVLEEVGGGSEPLTEQEQSFLLAHTDMDEQDLTPGGRAAARAAVATSRSNALADVEARSITTAEVAELLGRAESNVRRSRLAGDLLGIDVAGRLRFPVWQFVDGRPIPGLRQVLAALPRYLHPLTVERWMTTPSDTLEGLPPTEWLASGGVVDVVVQRADELGYT